MSELLSTSAATDCVAANGAGTTILSGDLSIRDTEVVRHRLTQMMKADGPLRIDLGGVTGIDTSILQLLIAAKRSVDHQGGSLEIEGFGKSPLPAFMTALGLASDELYNGPHATERQGVENRDAEPVIAPEHGDADDLFWLSNDQLARLHPFFPTRSGKPRADDRRVLSGIIHVKLNGLRWQDAPREYGQYKTLYTRWKRWKDKGIFTRMQAELSVDANEQAGATVDVSWLQALQAPQGD